MKYQVAVIERRDPVAICEQRLEGPRITLSKFGSRDTRELTGSLDMLDEGGPLRTGD